MSIQYGNQLINQNGVSKESACAHGMKYYTGKGLL
jgi:hypothetical protein